MNFEKNWKKREGFRSDDNLNTVYSKSKEYSDEVNRNSIEGMVDSFNKLTDGDGVDYEKLEVFDKEIYKKFENGEYLFILNLSKKLISEKTGLNLDRIDPANPDDAVLLTEAVNLSAKVKDMNFYTLKPYCILSANKIGAPLGVETDDSFSDIYYLVSYETGVASFHDPGDVVRKLSENVLKEEVPEWKHGWSEVFRQDEAYDILMAVQERHKDDNANLYIKKMNYSTSPGATGKEKYDNKQNLKNNNK